MGSTALVLVDIQRDYFPGGKFTLEGMEDAAQKASKLLQYFREQKMKIFHVRHIEEDANAPFMAAGSAGIEIHKLVEPKAGEPVIEKHFPNSFLNTTLQEQLKGAGVSSVAFCGAMSNMCIDATVRAACDFGFQCFVVEDACAAAALEFKGTPISAKQVHGAFMAALGSAYAQVLSLEDFLNSLK